MKTEDLIASLAADPTPPHRPAALKATALAAAVAVTLAGFAAVLGLRHDLHTALGTWAFAAKLAILVSAFVAAVLAARLSMNPLVERPWPRIATAVAAAIFLASVGLEVASYPVSAWGPRLVGDYGVVCLVSIALLAAAPLAAILWIMRDGAPRSPGLAGAAAGATAGTLAATVYANHCTNDSAFYVMAWYLTGIMIVSAAGALAGRRWLAW